MRGLYRRSNLEIVEPIRYGWWSGKTGAPGFQDLVLAGQDGPLTRQRFDFP